MDERLVDELVREVVARLSPERIWSLVQGCRPLRIERDAEHLRYIVECGADRIGCLDVECEGVESDLARYIDHTLLKASARQKEIEKLCAEAARYEFASVCINPCWVRLAARLLEKTPVEVCTVVGFPLGAATCDTKVFETRRAIFDGAGEIDMVLNVGALRSGLDRQVGNEISAVVSACHENGAICKVILENAFLSSEEKVKACTLAKESEADFVKTSTGFGPGGATTEDVALMRRVVGPELGVKAAGGIRDERSTRQMLAAGANRIGASAGVKIVGAGRSTVS